MAKGAIGDYVMNSHVRCSVQRMHGMKIILNFDKPAAMRNNNRMCSGLRR
jgi:hypothetical protein